VIIVTGGFFVGLVLTLQTYDALNRFGAPMPSAHCSACPCFANSGRC
jgi:ABC-type transporter Mla maintaining outer membrane lipid asymmetry permease subunit MlaE